MGLLKATAKSLTASVPSESVARDQRERPQMTPRKRQRKSANPKVFEQDPPADMVGQLAIDFMAMRDQEHSNTSDTTLRGYAKTLPRVWVVFKQQFDDWNGKNPLDILEVGNVRAQTADVGCSLFLLTCILVVLVVQGCFEAEQGPRK